MHILTKLKNNDSVTLNGDEYFVSSIMNRFRKIEDHFKEACRRGWGASAESFSFMVENLRQRELILYASDLLNIKTTTNDPQNSLNYLVWPTKGGFSEIKRGLDSLLKECSPDELPEQGLILDDSEKPHTSFKELVEYSLSRGFPLSYIGPAEKSELKDFLKKDFPVNLIDFALSGPAWADRTLGANWNCMQLLTTGSNLISVDDDMIFQFQRPTSELEQSEISPSYNPQRIDFFEESTYKIQDLESIRGKQFFNKISNLLNISSVLNCFSQEDDPLFAIKNVTIQQLQSLLKNDSPIALVLPGLYGDPGSQSALKLLLESWETQGYLFDDNKRLQAALDNRWITKQTTHDSFCRTAFFMGGIFGMNNSLLFPPFFPLMRNSESVFGSMIYRCFQNYYTGFIPEMIAHEPLFKRKFTEEDLFNFNPRVSEFMNLIIMEFDFSFSSNSSYLSPEKKMIHLGNSLKEIGQMDWNSFSEMFKPPYLKEMELSLDRLEKKMDNSDFNNNIWNQYFEKYLQNVSNFLQKSILPMPWDLQNILEDPEETGRQFLSSVYRYGELLTQWTDIRTKAQDILSSS